MLVECCHRVKSWLLCRGIDYMLQAKLGAETRRLEFLHNEIHSHLCSIVVWLSNIDKKLTGLIVVYTKCVALLCVLRTVAQTELLQSQGEVKRLLDRVGETTRDRAEMV